MRVTAVAAPAGMDAALVRNGLTCAVNLTNPAERCILYPTLTPRCRRRQSAGGFRRITSSVMSRATRSTTRTCTARSSTARLFSLPAGEVQAVFGVEHRPCRDRGYAGSEQHRRQSVQPDERHADPRQGQRLRGVHRDRSADRRRARPGVNELTFNGSFRYTDYDSYGSDTTYKMGLCTARSSGSRCVSPKARRSARRRCSSSSRARPAAS